VSNFYIVDLEIFATVVGLLPGQDCTVAWSLSDS